MTEPRLTFEQAQRLLDLRAEKDRREGCKFGIFFPDKGEFRREFYPKHLDVFRCGGTHKERLFMAANRVGKSEVGAYELTAHATGKYPPWWEGRRFDTPIEAWACGTTSETTRDIVQSKLFGSWEGAMNARLDGNGMVPVEDVVDWVKRPHGLPGSMESAWIKHVSGGRSVIGFKMYEQGRKSFEGTAKHFIWCDEEPPEDCYIEMLYRTTTTKGITLVTFTPLQGMSNVVRGFIQPDRKEATKFKTVIQAGWDDVPHLDEHEKEALLATTPPHQRDARSKGTPQLGSGAIFGIPESEITVADFDLPRHWPRGYGLDAGGGAKPTAAAFFARDPETKTEYLYSVYKRESPEPAIHAAAVKARGEWLAGVGDVAGLILTAHDAEQLISVYQRLGLDIILPDKSVEAGLLEVWELMSAGLFKVFASCAPWFEEFRLYHRDEKGRIVKKNDHLMDASRYYIKSGRDRAKAPPRASDSALVMPDIVEPGAGWMR